MKNRLAWCLFSYQFLYGCFSLLIYSNFAIPCLAGLSSGFWRRLRGRCGREQRLDGQPRRHEQQQHWPIENQVQIQEVQTPAQVKCCNFWRKRKAWFSFSFQTASLILEIKIQEKETSEQRREPWSRGLHRWQQGCHRPLPQQPLRWSQEHRRAAVSTSLKWAASSVSYLESEKLWSVIVPPPKEASDLVM